MQNQNRPSLKSSQQGVVIIEAMVAILIFSVGVLGIVGMQANMVKNTSESKYRADAGYVAQQLIGALWTHPDNLPADGSTTTPTNAAALSIIEPDITGLAGALPGGTYTIERAGNQYEITISWQQPGEEAHQFTTTASIAGN